MDFEEYRNLSQEEKMRVRLHQMALVLQAQNQTIGREPIEKNSSDTDGHTAPKGAREKSFTSGQLSSPLYKGSQTGSSNFQIYPTMQIQNGRCVTLEKGRLDEPQIWHVDPVETAKGFATAGAEWMHLTDFNALEGDNSNEELIAEIIRGAGIPVQLGGGMRSREKVEHWIDKGAGRIVIGTLAARDPHLVQELAKHHPDQIVLAVDIWQGQVVTDGWRKSGAFTPETYLEAFKDTPFTGIIITDIDAELADTEAQMGLISHLASLVKLPVIASGVVQSADDISRLRYIHNISGALVGRALFRKTVTVEELLITAQPEPGQAAAEFN